LKQLSVIIVNYNVCYFLEQALLSVKKACQYVDAEIFVVDNNSVDGSAEMVKTRFPEVNLISNKNNVGFSKANNCAIKQAQGKYILLLNPDTVVEEDTFAKCCRFMDEHPEAGALGVKMVDGQGNFLSESKRGLPTPWIAFYKVFGLAALFPKSRKFGRYHLGFLSNEEIHEVEVLSGAFMFVRKAALDKVGLLDEDYFMYGEDIDLSYRIIRGGYKNYYFPETRIIHYKGESTRRTSLNYVRIFYKAMIIFAEKHFSSQHASYFSLLINLAIYIRASISVAARVIRQSVLPMLDAVTIFGGMYFLKEYWEENYKYVPGEYPPEFMTVAVPGYIMVWLLTVYFSGGYDDSVKSRNIMRGVVIGTILISAFTNFIDPLRFSKALIILGGVFSFFSMISIRVLLHFIRYRNIALGTEKKKRVVVIGNGNESNRVLRLMREISKNTDVVGYVSPDIESELGIDRLGDMQQVQEIINIYQIDEVIFCSRDIPAHQIIEWMTTIGKRSLEYKIVPDDSNYIIGSNSKEKQGDFYTVNIEMSIIKNNNIRNKRVLDIAFCLLVFIFSPLLIWFVERPTVLFRNVFRVLSGSYTWVGYADKEHLHLPKIRKGILSPASNISSASYLDRPTLRRLDMLYAKDYKVATDLNILVKSFRKLGSA
jgi:GT2 family glycosyltransferase